MLTNTVFSTFLPYIASGMVITLKYAFFSVCGGLAVSLVLAVCMMKKNKYSRLLSHFYISLFRGTPLLVQLSIVYFGIPSLTGYNISAFGAGIITFSLNSGAYIAEILRAGIQSIDKGQIEAAKSLHISNFYIAKDIIFPQALRRIFPALMNETISMVKETALISTIGENDIMRRAQHMAAEHYNYMEPLCIAAFCYYILVLGLTQISLFIEKRLHYGMRT